MSVKNKSSNNSKFLMYNMSKLRGHWLVRSKFWEVKIADGKEFFYFRLYNPKKVLFNNVQIVSVCVKCADKRRQGGTLSQRLKMFRTRVPQIRLPQGRISWWPPGHLYTPTKQRHLSDSGDMLLKLKSHLKHVKAWPFLWSYHEEISYLNRSSVDLAPSTIWSGAEMIQHP